jgi:SanA protein
MFKRRRFFKIVGLAVVVLAMLTVCWNWWVGYSVREKVYSLETELPDRHVGLLLGTSKFAKQGQINLYYKYRLEATETLYKRGQIEFILVSGDNSTIHYNEPVTMKNDLIALGIPDSNIVEDYAGFRTLDSMIRSKAVFGQDQIVVISQRFHVERALFLAKARGIDAIGFCAEDVSTSYGFKTSVREHFARIKMFIDLYILNKQPKFLGEPVQIPE